MEDFSNINLQENDDEELGDTTIVRLAERPSSDGTQHKKMKSGLIMISNAERFRRQTETLTTGLMHRIPTRCPSQNIGNEVLQSRNTQLIEFYDVTDCDRYVRACDDKYVILILSNHHAQNTNTVSDFAQIPQIIVIYCCMSEASFNGCIPQMSFESQFSVLNSLPETLMDTPIHYVDSTAQYVLMDLFFAELIQEVPRTKNTIEAFIEFCRSMYENDPKYPIYVKQMEEFFEKYNEEDAIRWYTRSDSFAFRMAIKTCASLDFTTLSKIGFFLRDMHIQLKKLHDKQLGKELKPGLVVFRGVIISKEEFESLKTEGALFFTRSFLSATKKKDVAHMYSGKDTWNNTDDKESVRISFQIDYIELEEKPIAYLGKHSQVPDEEEVMLSMGMIFCVKTCRKVEGNANYTWEIQMVRGEKEANIEKVLGRLYSLAQISASAVFRGMNIFGATIHDGEHSGESGSEKFHIEQDDIGTRSKEQLIINHTTNTNHVGFLTKARDILPIRHAWKILIGIIVLIVISAIVVPLAILLPPKTQSTTTTTTTAYPYLVCSAIPSVQNPLFNYQVEYLDLTCSQPLSNMTTILTVQRTFNETYAQQYQNFLNSLTIMTYVTTPTELIYYWDSLPGILIFLGSFGILIGAQFYYTPGSTRNTSGDTWEIWLESTYGQTLHLYGTF